MTNSLSPKLKLKYALILLSTIHLERCKGSRLRKGKWESLGFSPADDEGQISLPIDLDNEDLPPPTVAFSEPQGDGFATKETPGIQGGAQTILKYNTNTMKGRVSGKSGSETFLENHTVSDLPPSIIQPITMEWNDARKTLLLSCRAIGEMPLAFLFFSNSSLIHTVVAREDDWREDTFDASNSGYSGDLVIGLHGHKEPPPGTYSVIVQNKKGRADGGSVALNLNT